MSSTLYARMWVCLNPTILQGVKKPKLINFLKDKCHCSCTRQYCSKKKDNKEKDSIYSKSNKEISQTGLESKYKIFQESEAPILLDVYEEKIQLEERNLQNEIEEDIHSNEFYGLNMKRGIRGVFDIGDLIELLRRDRAADIFVAELSLKARYVDYIVIVTGRSRRHMIALAEIVRRLFKKKRLPTDILPRVEGENSSAWIALDLGNIALHIFSEEARKAYDLESLWSVGPEFDPHVNEPDDPLIALLKQHTIRVDNLATKGQLL